MQNSPDSYFLSRNPCEIQAYNENTEEVTVVTVEKLSKEQLEELELDNSEYNAIEIEV